MSAVMKELKAEISRLARKEIRSALASAKKTMTGHRALIAGLRRQIDSIQKELSVLKKAVPSHEKALIAKQEPEGRFWITGKGVKTLRKRLGLTQTQFGKLAGVSVPTVVNWEGSEGKASIRQKAVLARLQQIKGMKKRLVNEILGVPAATTSKKRIHSSNVKDAKPK